MFERKTIIVVGLLALSLILAACGGSDLAGELTPIPTLPQGEEPELVEALQAPPEVTSPPSDGGAMEESDLVALGEELFVQCSACHGAVDGAGPALAGMGERAATRVDGMTAEAYLHESIVEPGAYVVEGFADIMPKSYGEEFSDEELDALVAYILAQGGEGAAEPVASEAEDTGEPAATAGDAANGETLFAGACSGCHGAVDGAGPALAGMGERASTRVDGMTAEEYLHESIVDPGAFVVEGFANIMPPAYGDQFSDDELSDIVAYILTQ